MGFYDDLDIYAHDYLAIPEVQDVTYTPRNPTATAVEDVKAVRGEIVTANTTEIGGVLGLAPGVTTWGIWEDTLPNVTPQAGDYLEDEDGVDWTVQGVTHQELDPKWLLTCVKQAL